MQQLLYLACSTLMDLVRSGELSIAAPVLTSSGLAPATADTARKLAEKHPARTSEIPIC